MEPPSPLSNLLKTWRHEPPDDPHFDAEVWARIAANRRNASAGTFFRWALPLSASVALVLGAGSAVRDSRQQHAERMAASYVQSVDPLQMAGPQSQP